MLENRKQIILFFFYTIGIIYLSRLLFLQVIDSKYQSLGSTNSIKREVQIPLRGQIYDRERKLMVANVEVYDMYVIPKDVKNLDTLKFCNLFGLTREYFDSTMAVATKFSKKRASLFLRQLSKEDFARVADALIQFQGFTFEQSFFRTYPGNTMANALGYIGEIPKKQFEDQEEEYYRKGDYIGLTGLEKQYELPLRGQRGVRFKLMNVNAEDKGSYAEGEFDTLSVIGKNLYTTINLELQQLADSLFQGKVGSVVAIEPATGEILALGSYPTYDPSLLSGREFSKNFAALGKNIDKPLINRATTSFYRPGSTFKLVQAAVGLQAGVITPSTSFVGAPTAFAYHSGAYEAANLNNAIQLSSNPYFFNVFRKIIGNNSETNVFKSARVGLQNWHDIVEKFGFGVKLGIDLPGEKKGILPDVERYDKVYGKMQWKFSNIYSVSIGEGELAVNVLKLANVAATIANRGYWRTPHLVKGMGYNGEKIDDSKIEKHETGIENRHFEAVINGMALVVKSGTGRASGVEGIEVCGKTGTSQNKKGKDHAIFIAFAPRDNPKIAIAAVVENGTFGGKASAPITGLMIEKYLKGSISPNRRAYAEAVKNTRWATVAVSSGSKASIPSATSSPSARATTPATTPKKTNQ